MALGETVDEYRKGGRGGERQKERVKWGKEEGKGVREKGARRREALENNLIDYSKGYAGKVGTLRWEMCHSLATTWTQSKSYSH